MSVRHLADCPGLTTPFAALRGELRKRIFGTTATPKGGWRVSCQLNPATNGGSPRVNTRAKSVNLLISEKSRLDWQEFG
jgi:hypothetical protein